MTAPARPPRDPRASRRPDHPKTWTCKHDGQCPACGEIFAEGVTLTRTDDDDVVHADCEARDCLAEHGTSEPVLGVACRRCCLMPSTSGACGCDPEDQEARP